MLDWPTLGKLRLFWNESQVSSCPLIGYLQARQKRDGWRGQGSQSFVRLLVLCLPHLQGFFCPWQEASPLRSTALAPCHKIKQFAFN